MKFSSFFRLYGGLLSIMFLWSSCSNDFDLTSQPKDIPVIYGLLSLNDTAHYIRVERAFLDPETSAYQLAKVPDSLYYPNAEVMLIGNNNKDTFRLSRVDGNLEGYPRKDGIFATSPNYLYKIRANQINLKGNAAYQILVRPNYSDLESAQSTTNVLSKFEIVAPAENKEIAIQSYFRDIKIEWNADQAASIFDVNLVYEYQETEPGGSVFIDKTLQHQLAKNKPLDKNNLPQFTFKAGDIYRFLGASLTQDPTVRRIFKRMSIRVSMGGSEFNDIRLANIANSGIAGAQTPPEYTNIKNGLGIFSSRIFDVAENYILNPASLDSLKKGIYTEELNFE